MIPRTPMTMDRRHEVERRASLLALNDVVGDRAQRVQPRTRLRRDMHMDDDELEELQFAIEDELDLDEDDSDPYERWVTFEDVVAWTRTRIKVTDAAKRKAKKP